MLTIDDPEIERFIREEAQRTGDEPAAVLRRYLPQLDGPTRKPTSVPLDEQRRRLAVLRRIQQEVARLPLLDDRTPDELLGYDENGLPT